MGLFEDTLYGFRGGIETKQQNTDSAQVTTLASASADQPLWASPYPKSEVTFPQIMLSSLLVFGSSGPASAGTAHVHTSPSLEYAGTLYTCPVNSAMGGYVPVTQSRFVNVIGWYMRATTALAGGQVWFQLWREEPDRSLTRLLHEDITSYITTTNALIEMTTPGGFTIRQGERWLVRVVNKTSPARDIALLGLAETTGSPKLGHGIASASTADTTYSTATADAAAAYGAVIPFIYMAAETPPPEDRIYQDDFNRANLGPNWTWLGRENGTNGDLGISNGHVFFDGPGDLGQVDFVYPTASDYMRADFDVHNIQGGPTDEAGVGVIITMDRQQTSGVALFVDAVSASIYARNGATWTQVETISIEGNNGPWSIYYNPDTNIYTALKDGQDISLTWEDASNLIPHGANYRYSALQITRDIATATIDGGEIDNLVIRDWRG